MGKLRVPSPASHLWLSSVPLLFCSAPAPPQAMDVPEFWDLLIAAVHAADAASPLNSAEVLAAAVPHRLAVDDGAALN